MSLYLRDEELPDQSTPTLNKSSKNINCLLHLGVVVAGPGQITENAQLKWYMCYCIPFFLVFTWTNSPVALRNYIITQSVWCSRVCPACLPLGDDTKLEWRAIITVQQKQLFPLFSLLFTAGVTDKVMDKTLKDETGSIAFRQQKPPEPPYMYSTMCSLSLIKSFSWWHCVGSFCLWCNPSLKIQLTVFCWSCPKMPFAA